jgi:hypothetical protein
MVLGWSDRNDVIFWVMRYDSSEHVNDIFINLLSPTVASYWILNVFHLVVMFYCRRNLCYVFYSQLM